jgi:glycine C-acetyltransferase
VVSESLFSMDGDTAPLSSLVDLARNYRALLVVDEAHALGVLGGSGAGLAAALPVDVRMATLGKALGGFGAFVVAANPIIELLVNRARTFVFTTALPPAIAAAAIAAIDLVSSDEGDARRKRLAHVCASFHDRLADLGLAEGASDDRLAGHIVPLHVGDAGRVMELSRSLLARGIFIQGIRPPTVPDGSARLRVTLTAAHADDDLDLAIAALAELREHFGRG